MTPITPMPIPTRNEDYEARLAEAVNHWMALPDSPNDLLDLNDTVMVNETPANIPWPTARPVDPIPGLLTEIIAALPVALVVLNFKGSVKLWTDAAAMLFGWSSAEVIGAPPPFVTAAQIVEHKTIIQLLRSGNVIGERIVSRLCKHGKCVTLALHATQTISGDIVLTFREILPSRVATVADTKTPEIPSSKLEALGRMVGSVSHDFNNVLGAICGSAELMSDRFPFGSAERELIDVIRTAGKHATGLTKRLMHAAKPSKTSAMTEVDLSSVVDEMLPLIRALVSADVKVTLKATPNLPGTNADVTILEQVVLNLATNAGQAMPRGGHLRLRTDLVTLELPKLDLAPGRYVVLTVSDTGTGFDNTTRAKMFEPYFTTKSTGTGLGLATVKDLVRQAGGSIELDSEPGRGSAFRIFFPALADPTLALDGNGCNALVADDDPSIREVIKRVLESVGFNVLEAATGDEALQQASWTRDEIDVLVTDVVMPGCGGRRLAEKLRLEWPDLGVVFASGYPPLEETQPASTAFLTKPFSAKNLLASVKSVMRATAKV
ncbi:hypothetical protein BH11PLA2_BH11PLA2_39950 [soil metagenome]